MKRKRNHKQRVSVQKQYCIIPSSDDDYRLNEFIRTKMCMSKLLPKVINKNETHLSFIVVGVYQKQYTKVQHSTASPNIHTNKISLFKIKKGWVSRSTLLQKLIPKIYQRQAIQLVWVIKIKSAQQKSAPIINFLSSFIKNVEGEYRKETFNEEPHYLSNLQWRWAPSFSYLQLINFVCWGSIYRYFGHSTFDRGCFRFKVLHWI